MKKLAYLMFLGTFLYVAYGTYEAGKEVVSSAGKETYSIR